MFKKITVALAVLTATFVFSLSAWGADQSSSTNGAIFGKARAQAQTAGCDNCVKKAAAKTQASAGKDKPCGKNCKDCPSTSDCKTRKNCDKDCVKQGKGATKESKNCIGKKSGCDKKTKDGKPCQAGCDIKAVSAKK